MGGQGPESGLAFCKGESFQGARLSVIAGDDDAILPIVGKQNLSVSFEVLLYLFGVNRTVKVFARSLDFNRAAIRRLNREVIRQRILPDLILGEEAAVWLARSPIL